MRKAWQHREFRRKQIQSSLNVSTRCHSSQIGHLGVYRIVIENAFYRESSIHISSLYIFLPISVGQ
jgi:hypothetical protein